MSATRETLAMTDEQVNLQAALERLSQEDRIALQDLIVRACTHLDNQPRRETVFDFLEQHNPRLLHRWLNELEAPRTPLCPTRKVRNPSSHTAASCHAHLKLFRDEEHGHPTCRALCGFRSTFGKPCSATIGAIQNWNPESGGGAGDVYEPLRMIDPGGTEPLRRSKWPISAPTDFPGFFEQAGGRRPANRSRSVIALPRGQLRREPRDRACRAQALTNRGSTLSSGSGVDLIWCNDFER